MYSVYATPCDITRHVHSILEEDTDRDNLKQVHAHAAMQTGSLLHNVTSCAPDREALLPLKVDERKSSLSRPVTG